MQPNDDDTKLRAELLALQVSDSSIEEMLKNHRWLSDDEAATIELELTAAFGPLQVVLDRERFNLVRHELLLLYPDDLLGALPYVLIGFLRFGVSTSLNDRPDLHEVVQFLNIRCHPADNPPDEPEEWEIHRDIGRKKNLAVSGFSCRQARAIRHWLEAVRDCDILLHYDDIGYAITFWLEFEQSHSEDAQGRN